jgi:hypothetical protein
MRSSRTILITAVLLFLAAASEAMAAPKRILLLHSFGRDFAPWNEYEKSIALSWIDSRQNLFTSMRLPS